MPDYKKMYYELFNKVTDIIEQLQEAQKKTEEMFMNGEEKEVKITIAKE